MTLDEKRAREILAEEFIAHGLPGFAAMLREGKSSPSMNIKVAISAIQRVHALDRAAPGEDAPVVTSKNLRLLRVYTGEASAAENHEDWEKAKAAWAKFDTLLESMIAATPIPPGAHDGLVKELRTRITEGRALRGHYEYTEGDAKIDERAAEALASQSAGVTDEMIERAMEKLYEWQPPLREILDYDATRAALQAAMQATIS